MMAGDVATNFFTQKGNLHNEGGNMQNSCDVA